MKKYTAISFKLAVIFYLLFMLASCQEEIVPEVEIGQDGITYTDEIAELIAGIATRDGSPDNIIDRSSCTTVKFPISGILEDEELVFNSLDDVLSIGVQVLEIDWIFPIQMILYNHTDVMVLDEDMLDDIQDACEEGGSDADNECIDFIYPFTVSVFNELTEKVDTQVLSSDKAVFEIFSSENLITNITYPVSLIDSNGTLYNVTNNQELVTVIHQAPECDEEDIIEFEEQFENEINDLLLSTSWSVTTYTEGSTDKTSLFSGYTIQFNEDNTLLASGTEDITGNWEVELLETSKSLSIEFDTDNESFLLLNENWNISTYDLTKITIERDVEQEIFKYLELTIKE